MRYWRSLKVLAALLLTWLGYVLLNLFYSASYFPNNAQIQPTLSDLERWSVIAQGSSRPSELIVRKLDQNRVGLMEVHLAPNWLVIPGTRALFQSEPSQMPPPNRVTWGQILKLLEAERNYPGPIPDAPGAAPAVRHTRLGLQLIRLRLILQTESAVDSFQVLTALEKAYAAIDPWNKEGLESKLSEVSNELNALLNRYSIDSKRLEIGSPWPLSVTFAAHAAALHPFRPLQANPLSDRSQGNREIQRGFTIVYFPPAPAKSPNAEARPPEFLAALEVRWEGSWRQGERLVVRHRLAKLEQLNFPLIPSREPEIEMLTRKSGLSGLRPIAMQVTEQQIADRFFPIIEEISRGAGIEEPMRPANDDETKRATAMLRQILEESLGSWDKQPAPLFDLDSLSDASPALTKPTSLESLLIWPRRFNGGTWWGMIQFSVMFLGALFLLEWLLAEIAFRRVRLILTRKSPLREDRLLDEMHQDLSQFLANRDGQPLRFDRILRGLSGRLHLMRTIAMVLPLVGFLGTVAGLSNSLIGSSGVSSPNANERQMALQSMQTALGTAFNKSLLAFALAIVTTFILRSFERKLERMESIVPTPASPNPPSSSPDKNPNWNAIVG